VRVTNRVTTELAIGARIRQRIAADLSCCITSLGSAGEQRRCDVLVALVVANCGLSDRA